MTIVERQEQQERQAITGGVDTHSEIHVAAALDPLGGQLGIREFPATAAGYKALLGWLEAFGDVALVGVEGTGSYGAGLARHLAAAGIRVVEGRPRGPAGTGTATASPAPSTRSARRGPPCPAGPRARPGAATARSRRSGP
jgi:transposase